MEMICTEVYECYRGVDKGNKDIQLCERRRNNQVLFTRRFDKDRD